MILGLRQNLKVRLIAVLDNMNAAEKISSSDKTMEQARKFEFGGQSVSSRELLFKPIILKGDMTGKIDIGLREFFKQRCDN